MPTNKQHGGARLRAGRYTKQIRHVEDEKFLFMAKLSDEEPLQSLPTSMPCQMPGCTNYTKQGIIVMNVNRVWSIKPMCSALHLE